MSNKTKYPIAWLHGKHQSVMITGRQKLKLPPLAILEWLFRYDESTGKLFRIRESNGKSCEPEREIITVNGSGYLHVGITDSNGLMKKLKVHQLIFYMCSGSEPLSIVDHISGDKLDNRFSNLRLVNDSLNQRNAKMQSNNTSGITGVSWNKPNGKWVARAYDNTGKLKHLGCYLDKEEAAQVVSAFYSNPSNGYSERHGI